MPGGTRDADVVIIGAGPAGSSLAAQLAGRGLDVLLVDRAAFPRDKTCGDGLTPRAIPALERLGVLSQLEAAGYQKTLGARLHPAGGDPWAFRFADYPVGLPSYGLVVPRFELDALLLQHALSKGARFLAGYNAVAPLRDKGRQVGGVLGDLAGKQVTLRASLTVLAVGANIGLLRAFGLLDRMPPGINAVRGYFSGVPDLDACFDFYFEPQLASGYAWVFPLSDGRANVGLGLAGRGNGGARNSRRLLEEFICRSPRLRGARPVGPVKGFPLRIDFPRFRPGGDGFLLVGESLGLVNPVTGEGIDLALESAEWAAPVIESALMRGDAAWQALAAYQRNLVRHYAGTFRGLQVLLHVATGPRAISVLVRQAKKKPRLARLLAGINQGVASPWQAFSPLTWWDILT